MAGRRVTLKDLLDAGLLRPNEKLTYEPSKGDVHVATLDPDGSILYRETAFRRPSAWARHVAGKERNVWLEIYARGRPLNDLRSRVLGEVTSSTSAAPVTSPAAPEEEAGMQQRLLELMLLLTPVQFEEIIAEFLKAKGFSNMHLTSRTRNGGIDGHCELPFIKLTVAFQAKRYGRKTLPSGRPPFGTLRERSSVSMIEEFS